jgi:hypothetical protein
LRLPSIPSLRLAFSPEWGNHDLWGLSIKCVGTPSALEVHANVLFGWSFRRGVQKAEKGSAFVSYSAQLRQLDTGRQLNWSEMLKSTPVYPSASIFRTRHMQSPPSFQECQWFWTSFWASENDPISLWLQDPRHGPEIPKETR